MTLVLSILLGLGVVVALAVGSGALRARLMAVVAMLLLALLALLPPHTNYQAQPRSMRLVSTGEVDRGQLAATVRAAAGEDEVQVVAAGDDWSGVLSCAALAVSRAEDLAVCWNAPLAAAGPARVASGAAWTTAPALSWDPQALQLRTLAAPRAGRPLALSISAIAAAAELAATVTIVPPATESWQRSVVIPAGGAVDLQFEPDVVGRYRVEVVVEWAGRRIVRRGAFECTGTDPVLVVDPSGTLVGALSVQGTATVAADRLPADLTRFSAVVLGQALSVSPQRRLVTAVQDGLGLFAVGAGLQSEGDPLRALLPVRVLRPVPGGVDLSAAGEERPDRPDAPAPPADPAAAGRTGEADLAPGGPVEVARHSVAMVLVVDRSGSMGQGVGGGPSKMSYVKTSAMRTAEALAAGDLVGLVTFGNEGQGRVELPLVAATERAAVRRGIRLLAHAAESTYPLSGLRLAGELLARSKAAVRHIVVLTDGEFWDKAVVLRSLANELRTKHHITLSIVSIENQDTDTLHRRNAELLARDGGGSYLPVEDPNYVPQLVSAEVVSALERVGRKPAQPNRPGQPDGLSDESSGSGGEFEPGGDQATRQRVQLRAVADSPLLEPRPAPWPSLGAAAATGGKLDAYVLLVARASGQPLLAYGNRGLGRAGVFASDLAGAAGRELRRAEAFPAWLSQWVTEVGRPRPQLPRDRLVETRVMPPAPTPPEQALLLAGTAPGAELRPLDGFELPPRRHELEFHSRAPDWAIAALVALLLLAMVEWWATRCWLPGSGRSPTPDGRS